jgi:hypothetical protein
MELTENGKCRMFAVNRKWKRKIFVCLLQTELEKGISFPW